MASNNQIFVTYKEACKILKYIVSGGNETSLDALEEVISIENHAVPASMEFDNSA